MAISPFMAAINQICDEKGLSKEIVLETVEAALAAAYRKDFGKPNQIIRAELNPETNEVNVFQIFKVVKDDEVEDLEHEIALSDAKKIKKGIKVEEEITKELTYHSDFGRIAAQTAKQVIIQRIREAERDILYKEYKEKEKQILSGVVQQIEGDNIIINIGKASGIMMPSDQSPNERYNIGQRLKIYLSSVEETNRGPRILVSRSHPGLISGLFASEVPEITAGTVVIKTIAREAGSRTKVAVASTQENLDPVGSCVGQRGTRVQSVLAEIGEEKIDIILWNDDDKTFISNSLSPAKISSIKTIAKIKKAIVSVPEDQLSLAIGKKGQNVRLASKLAGWSIDIVKEGTEKIAKKKVAGPKTDTEAKGQAKKPKELKKTSKKRRVKAN